MINRVIYSESGTLTDISSELAKIRTGSYTFDSFATTNYIYIGQRAPFNHFFIKMGATLNTNPTQMSVHYWDGTVWVSAVDVRDLTNGLSQDGYVEFYPNKNKGWTRESTNFEGDVITGLEDIVIYDLFWARISFSDILDNDIIMKFIGQKFSDDDDLASEYPDLVRASVLSRFETGKTTWEEQHIRAAEVIEQDLIQKRVIQDKGQILDRDTYKLASVHKVAEIIFGSFGDDYADQKLAARNEYKDRMDKVIYNVDDSEDGILDIEETKKEQGWLSR
jgi:hypothetical protein